MNSTIKKAKTLFPRNNYPIHHIFMETLYSYRSTENPDTTHAEITELSCLLGEEFVELVDLVEKDNNSNEFFTLCLKLKVKAKKLKSKTGEEFPADSNSNKQSGTLAVYIAAFEKKELNLQIEAERLEAIEREKSERKVAERFEALSQEREKEKSQYLKRFCDFPELEIFRIRRGSSVAEILTRLQNNNASEQDFFWLKEKGFSSSQITQAHHKFYLKRGKAHLAKWKVNNKPWSLVNAIADYRKGHSSQEILEVVESNYPFKFSGGNKQLNSALLTTAGGVYRDLWRYNESIKLGTEANLLTPNDFRPCTLLGASNMLLGNISEGHLWYEKAIERGFKPESHDSELRAIYFRSSDKIKKELKSSLLAKGYKYSWLTH